jgi:Flp pilus assembly protein TadD
MEAEALPYLLQSAENGPEQVSVWNDLGVVYSRLKQPAKARAALERAVKLAPREPKARLALAAELVRHKEYRLAQQHYNVLLTLDIPPKIENATHRAIALLEKEIALEKK